MINLFWYKMPKGETNFGDELGPYIINQLTNEKIRYIPFVNSWYKIIVLFLLGILKGSISVKNILDVINSIFAKKVLLSIGSIISSYNKKGTIVWGSGLLNINDKINNATFLAVRGKYTQAKIKQLGYKTPDVLGDPAMLLPLILKPSEKKYQIGIIPHFIHYNYINEKLKGTKIKVINLKSDIETVVNDITSCEKTYSTSLHGIIISHSYLIPSIWVKIGSKNIAGDNIKFKDYFSSVEINNYSPIFINLDETIKKILVDDKTLLKFGLPNKSIINIQKDLLRVFPYKIDKKYEKFL